MNIKPWKIEVYRDSADEWRWRLIASNGKIIADSAEGYSTKASCGKSARRLEQALSAGVFVMLTFTE